MINGAAQKAAFHADKSWPIAIRKRNENILT
jgi:hypothetical protein